MPCDLETFTGSQQQTLTHRRYLISNWAHFMPEQRASTPPSSPPGESLIRPFMPELDTVRGIAVLGVVLLHAFYWQYAGLSFSPWARRFMAATQPGWLGVNLFFVLSGFLITGILLDSKNKPHFYRRFYTRRALRILPAYYLLLILLLLLRTSSAAFVGLSFVYMANMTDFFGVACDYGPLWSLAVEEHFYILWPTVVRNLTAWRLTLVSASMVVLIPLLRATSFVLGYRSGLAWYTCFVADGLAAGSLLAIVLCTSVTRSQVKSLCRSLLGASILLGIAGQPFGILTRNQLLGAALQFTTINAFFAGILLLFLLAGTKQRKTLREPLPASLSRMPQLRTISQPTSCVPHLRPDLPTLSSAIHTIKWSFRAGAAEVCLGGRRCNWNRLPFTKILRGKISALEGLPRTGDVWIRREGSRCNDRRQRRSTQENDNRVSRRTQNVFLLKESQV